MKFTSFALMMLFAQAADTDSHRVQLGKSKYSRKQKKALDAEMPEFRAAGTKHIGNHDSKATQGNGGESSVFGAAIQPIWERIKKGNNGKSVSKGLGFVSQSHGDSELWDKAINYFEAIEQKSAHPKVKLDSKIDITNHLNIVRHGPLVMGSNHQGLDVIYDTAVDGLVVETDLCTSMNCSSNAYEFNTTDSSSYVQDGTTKYDIGEDYGVYSNITLAYNATETVYMTYPSVRADAFPFYALRQMEGESLSEVQGVLGFARQSSRGNNPLYLEKVKSTGHISAETISFYMGQTGEDSYVDIGAPTPASVKDSDYLNVAWFDQEEGDFFWEFRAVQGIQFGFGKYSAVGMTAGYQYGYDLEAPAIVSTGNALIYAPWGLGHELQLRMAHTLQHYYDPTSGIMIVSCDEKSWYQDFSIWIDDMEFEILVDDYFLSMAEMLGDEATREHDDVCMLAIVDDKFASYWTLGDTFLKGYYAVFDNDDHSNARMGFAPHATSEKNFVEQSRLPVENIANILWEITWVSLIFPPSSPLSVIAWIVGNIWVFFFGIYEMGNVEINVTIN